MTDGQDHDDSGNITVSTDKSLNGKNGAVTNFITTSKYTLLNFLPLNMFQQFRKPSNIYFAINMIIALIPDISPISPATAIMPLIIVVAVAAIKDGLEDYYRHKADKEWNSAPGKYDSSGNSSSGVISNGKVDADVLSKDVKVGDMIKLVRGETVRADVLLLASSDLDEHTAHIQTMQLDGETNAKGRQAMATKIPGAGGAHRNLTHDLITPEACSAARLDVDTVQPSADLHQWSGKLTYKGVSEGVGIEQFLFRGCVVVNTAWVYGLVVYTGMNTKMQKNNKPKVPKKSQLDRKLTKMIVLVFFIQQLVIFLMCALAVVHQVDNVGSAWYILTYLQERKNVELFFWRYGTYFILVSFMIPISLFVTIEFTKAIQAQLMKYDKQMETTLLDANGEEIGSDPVCCEPRSSDLNEQLAIVKYIFSDKTGTLTENRMQFHTGEIANPEQASGPKNSGITYEHRDAEDEKTINPMLREYLEQTCRGSNGADPPGPQDKRHTDRCSSTLWYLMNLAMCHELTILQNEDDSVPSKEPSTPTYQGASPDEVALAAAAQSCGVEFISRTSGTLAISILGKTHLYRIIDTLKFTSKRKMMSIVLEGPCTQSDGQIRPIPKLSSRFCLTKGADSVMLDNCAGAVTAEKDAKGRTVMVKKNNRKPDPWYTDVYQDRLQNELNKLGGVGLRTLVLAYKPLPDDGWFNKWHSTYSEAQKLVNPDARSSAMEESWSEMEKDFYAVGATAIEDKLQDKVPETVDFLIRAGVVIWMLTGDKQETAETIAGTARLIDKQSWQLCYLKAQPPLLCTPDASLPPDEARVRLANCEAWVIGLAFPNNPPPASVAADSYDAHKQGQATGKECFLQLALEQSQKARIAGRKCGLVTDGATLGVITPPGIQGIKSPDALAAVEKMWSDFIELSQLVNSGVLCRLTPEQKGKIVKVFQETTGETALAIGDGANDVPMINESFVGIGIMGLEGSQAVLASDYAIPRFKHLRRLVTVHGSGQTLFDSYLLVFQNIAFTSIPPLFVGIFEKDVHEDMCESIPLLYGELRGGVYYDKKTIAMWFGEAIFHSGLLFYLTYSTQRNDDIGGDTGRTIDLLAHGAVILSCQIFSVLAKIAVHIRCWNWFQFAGIWFSVLLVFFCLLVYSKIEIIFSASYFYDTGFYILADVKYWFWSFFFVIGMILAIDIPLMYIQKQYFPTTRDLAQRLHTRKIALTKHKKAEDRLGM